jgi:hypothetical protein
VDLDDVPAIHDQMPVRVRRLESASNEASDVSGHEEERLLAEGLVERA